MLQLYIEQHTHQLSEHQPAPIKPLESFKSDAEYRVYLQTVRSHEPAVEYDEDKRLFMIRWDTDDLVPVKVPEWVHRLVFFVLHECRAASIGQDGGGWPDGRPWDKQPWWRMKIWQAFWSGRAAAYSEKPRFSGPENPEVGVGMGDLVKVEDGEWDEW